MMNSPRIKLESMCGVVEYFLSPNVPEFELPKQEKPSLVFLRKHRGGGDVTLLPKLLLNLRQRAMCPLSVVVTDKTRGSVSFPILW